MEGWISLHRKFLEWEWYDDINVFKVFIHILLNANHKKKVWKGIEISEGSFVTGRKKLAVQIGLTEQQIRTSLSKLKSTNEITIKTTNLNSLISVVKWKEYQTNQPTKKPTNNQQITTTNNDNNDNKILERAKNFGKGLNDFKDVYSKKMLIAFYDYWTEPNKSNSKLRFEQEKTWDLTRRLKRWVDNEKN